MSSVTKSSGDTHSPRQVARALGVSESSLKRWCDRGLIQTTRTAGGHRKVLTADAIRFARQRGMMLANPELLGLPAPGSEKDTSLEQYARLLAKALLWGD
jgi:DNA-binding transcriptional MerR regulator